MKLRRDLLFIAALTLLTNFTYFICADWDLTFPDSITYIAPAKNLLHGYGFVTQPRLPETMRTCWEVTLFGE